MIHVVLVLFFLVVLYGYRPVQRWRMRHIPGPPPSWMIGNLIDIVRMGKHEAFSTWSQKYGHVYKIFEGGVMTVVIQDASLAKWINARMSNRHPIPYMELGEEERFNAAGILFARGAHHRGLRAAWQPMFHSGSLENFVGIMDEAISRLVSILDEAADNRKEVDIWKLFGDLTIQISGTTAFGIDMQRESTDLANAAKAFFDAAGQIENIYALLQVVAPCLAPAVRVLANVFPTASYRRAAQGRRTVRAFMSSLLRDHRNGKGKGDRTINGVSAGSFLDLMSRAVNKETGLPFTDMEVICQAFSFILAAYETSTAALAFAVHLLACHPDKMAKVQEEVDSQSDVFHGSFPYVDAVLKETLRMYPTVPLTIREAEKDITVPYRIPAGTHIAVCVYGLHHSKEHWKDPERFRPERFLPGGDAAYEAYMPFGDGVRGCVGQRYAWQEIVMTLVRLYRRFEIYRVDEGEKIPVRMSLSLAPRDGVRVRVVRRN